MDQDKDKCWYVAHCRGPNFRQLRERGFLTFYPDLDDYVFLEACPKNNQLLRKQAELCVAFLRGASGYLQVTGEDISKMLSKTTRKVTVGAQVLVLEGVGSNLEGTVLETDELGLRVRCDLKGFNRRYQLWVDYQELVEQDPSDGGKPLAQVLGGEETTDEQNSGGGREPPDLRHLQLDRPLDH